MHKDTETFKISSIQDAEAFAAYISRYREATSSPSPSGYDMRGPILNVYKYSRVHSKNDRINGRLLNAYIDLELTCLFMTKDSLLAAGTHNQLHDKGATASGSVLDDFQLFSGKVDILYSLSALSFRMRAFWDKYMGVLFLLYEHQKYEKYVDDRSRKNFFMKHAREWSGISVHLRKCLTNIVRTALIHSGQREAVRDIDNRNLCLPVPVSLFENTRHNNCNGGRRQDTGSTRRRVVEKVDISQLSDRQIKRFCPHKPLEYRQRIYERVADGNGRPTPRKQWGQSFQCRQ